MGLASATNRSVAGATIAALLSACTYVSPYVKPSTSNYCNGGQQDAAAGQDRACKRFVGTKLALDKINASADSVETKLSDATTTNRLLGLGTFALVTALAVKTAHGTAQNPIKNLALAAGGTYAASSLFSPATSESLYLTAQASLICIAGKGERLLAAYDSANAQLTDAEKYERDNAVTAALDNAQCNPILADPVPADRRAFSAAYDAAYQARSAARSSFSRAQSLDGSISQSLMASSNNLLTEMNRQLLAQNPSIDAIAAAGKTTNSISSGLLPTTATPVATTAGVGGDHGGDKSGAPVIPPSPCRGPPGTAAFTEAASRYNTIKDLLTQELNAIGDLSNGCLAAQAIPITPLAVNQTDVDLMPGKSATLVVTGGRAPYIATWIGPMPDEQKILSKQTFGLAGHLTVSEIAADKTDAYKLQIIDGAVVPSSVIVTVTVHPVEPVAPTTVALSASPTSGSAEMAKALKIMVQGGVSPYTAQWTTALKTPQIANPVITANVITITPTTKESSTNNELKITDSKGATVSVFVNFN